MTLPLQILLTFLCNVSTLTFGLQLGWLAPLQPDLQSNSSSPLGSTAEPLTDEEISWIGSIPGIVTLFGAPLYGYALDKLGRKYSLFLSTAPNIITYVLLIFATNVNFIYVSRIIGGICSCGGLIVGPIYIVESVHPKLRGTLGGMTSFAINLGVILSFILGSYSSYLVLNIVSLTFTIVFVFCIPFIPESPVQYMRKGQWLEAQVVYTKMWGKDQADLIKCEMDEYRTFFKERNQKVNVVKVLKYLIFDKGARRAMIITAMIMTTEMFTGFPALISYTVDIFMESGTVFSPYLAAILIAVFQLVFAFVGAFLIEKLGRKGVLTFCGPIIFLSLAVTSIYLVLKIYYPENSITEDLTVLPTISLIVYISFCTASFGAVCFVIIPEFFTPESRSTASTVLNLWYAILEFIVVKIFPSLTDAIELAGVFGIYSIFALVGTLYVYFVMFETRGLGFKKIQEKLKGID